jgi:hypothetical protein
MGIPNSGLSRATPIVSLGDPAKTLLPLTQGTCPGASGETIMKLDFKFPEWEPQYKAALLEVDRARLLGRVAAAEAAIRHRMRAIFGRADGDTERQAIGKALSALRVLKETPALLSPLSAAALRHSRSWHTRNEKPSGLSDKRPLIGGTLASETYPLRALDGGLLVCLKTGKIQAQLKAISKKFERN